MVGGASQPQWVNWVRLLAGLADRHHITGLDVQEIGPHQPEAEPFKLVRIYQLRICPVRPLSLDKL